MQPGLAVQATGPCTRGQTMSLQTVVCGIRHSHAADPPPSTCGGVFGRARAARGRHRDEANPVSNSASAGPSSTRTNLLGARSRGPAVHRVPFILDPLQPFREEWVEERRKKTGGPCASRVRGGHRPTSRARLESHPPGLRLSASRLRHFKKPGSTGLAFFRLAGDRVKRDVDNARRLTGG